MRDDELEVWRRQWHSQPAVPIELIRKVERQTVYMKLEWISMILPMLVGIGTTVAAVNNPTVPFIFLAVGTWLFIILGTIIQIQNDKGTWAPARETTAAYVDLSIRRCRRKLYAHRYGLVFSTLFTLFVLVVNYQMLAGYGAFRTFEDYLAAAGAYLFAAFVVAIVMFLMTGRRKKTKAELDYLLNLQRQMGEDQNG